MPNGVFGVGKGPSVEPLRLTDPQPAKRPVGVILISVYTALYGLYYLIIPSTLLGGLVSAFFASFSVFWIALGVTNLAATYGLWTFQTWGHRLIIALYLLPTLLSLLRVLNGTPGRGDLVTVGTAVLVVGYLLRPRIRQLYSDTGAGGERTVTAATPENIRTATAPPTADDEVLTNEAVLALVQAGLGEELIVQKIKYSRCAFSLSSSDLARLKKAGASDRIISNMLENQARRGVAR